MSPSRSAAWRSCFTLRRFASAKKRKAALQKGGAKAKDNAVEKIARKKQIADSLKELEKSKGRNAPSALDMKIEQAGLSISRRQFMMISAVVGA